MVILDTSSLVDLCFWDKEREQKVLSLVSIGDRCKVSKYAVFELARGFLAYLVMLHAKSMMFKRLADVSTFAGRLSFRAYYRGAVEESLTIFLRRQDRVGLSHDQEIIMFRSMLSMQIRKGWKKANDLNVHGFNPCGCVDTPGPSRKADGTYKIEYAPGKGCGTVAYCGIKAFSAGNRQNFESVRNRIQSEKSPDAESVARSKALRELYRNPRRDFSAKDCYKSGDAILVMESENDDKFMSKNIRHQEQIAVSLGVEFIGYRTAELEK